MFKVNIKITKTSFWCFYCKLWTYFTTFSNVFINDFEQVNVSWVMIKIKLRLFLTILLVQKAEAYLKSCQTSRMELLVKIVNGWKPLSIFAKSSILDVWHGFEYASNKFTKYLIYKVRNVGAFIRSCFLKFLKINFQTIFPNLRNSSVSLSGQCR